MFGFIGFISAAAALATAVDWVTAKWNHRATLAYALSAGDVAKPHPLGEIYALSRRSDGDSLRPRDFYRR